GDRHGLALLARSPAAAEPLLATAAAAGNRVSAVGRAAALSDLGRADAAVELLRATLAELEARPELSPAERDTCPYPGRFDTLRVGWERAAYDHPDDPAGESTAKLAPLTCRAWSLVAARTGGLSAYEAAVAACPDVPAARAALGCALARAGRFAEAVDHLRVA